MTPIILGLLHMIAITTTMQQNPGGYVRDVRQTEGTKKKDPAPGSFSLCHVRRPT